MIFTAAELPCELPARTISGSMFKYDGDIYCVIQSILSHPNYYIAVHMMDVGHCQLGCKCFWINDSQYYLQPAIVEACMCWTRLHFELPLWEFLNGALGEE